MSMKENPPEVLPSPVSEVKQPILTEFVAVRLERTLFSCSCWDAEHHFFVLEYDEGEISLEMRLNSYLPFIKRLWLGIKYIFGIGEPSYDSVILNKENRLKLSALLLDTKKKKSAIIPKKPRKIRATKATLMEKK